ncbi:MAG TPA: hypothetical protein VMS01_12915 [Stellaceae bacterium]|jgi:hypothetical protein|nr:hypothetical protein [Stellaceae bacterium]
MSARRLRLLPAILIGWTACGCAEKPYLSAGDASTAEVGYSRDLAAATAVAQEHCARYDKVPRYLDSAENIAYFACENR